LDREGRPALRAAEIIRTSPTMRQADVVIITDKEERNGGRGCQAVGPGRGGWVLVGARRWYDGPVRKTRKEEGNQ
jgi:hypothetical protein